MTTQALSVGAVAEAQRILDRAARRLLAARLDGDAIGATARTDRRLLDNGADQRATFLEREDVPIADANTDRRRGGSD
jgi:hypothetical protein